MSYTFGAELEIANFKRSAIGNKIKEWGVLDQNDCTVVNSDGTVGNPYEGDKGGEIVTRVCDSTDQLADYCTNIINALDTSAINHSCWLHIHVGVNRDLSLNELKSIAAYTYRWTLHLTGNTIINPPKLTKDGKVHERRNRTRLSVMTNEEYIGCQQAESIQEFWSFFERKRHLINIRPLRTYGTIEYRFLPATLYHADFLAAAKMVEKITDMIINKDESFNLNQLTYIRNHTIIDEELEEKFMSHKVEYRPKVDNFTLEEWK